MKKLLWFPLCLAALAWPAFAADAPIPAADPAAAFPAFRVPGHEREMTLLGELCYLHHSPATTCTLWDPWLPMSVLWPAVGEGQSADAMRAFYRQSLLSRPIDADGYVATRQHRGLAHSDGWPFPLWMQAGGIGWHFSLAGDVYAVQNGAKPTASLDGWQLDGLVSQDIDPDRGLGLALTRPDATLTTPPCDVDTYVAPFIRLEWACRQPPPGSPADAAPAATPGATAAATPGAASAAAPYLAWTTAEKPDFDTERQVVFSFPDGWPELRYVNVPMYRHPQWTGRFTRLRIGFGNSAPAEATIKSLITAVDSRHPINNPVFVQACCDYFNWTGDVDFLRQSLPRMRTALAFAIKEFDTRQNGCVLVPWVGHCGRPGFFNLPDGQKKLISGRGIGNNYWDLLPFGHMDCLATIYFYAALRQMVQLQQLVDRHPEWHMPPPPPELAANPMCRQAEEIRVRASKLFWNEDTGRFFACIDADGASHDYGFTFLNLEAVYYGFASQAQSRAILDWVAGRRTVEGDTSQGEDIYYWRFAPRATTRRNVDWYLWVWHRPEDIPWGGQVQDGGAVLGWSYHDLMARLKVLGPDDASSRLKTILDWFAEVRAAGGYRAYYATPGRGSLQGGGTPGGLGLDQEFLESVLVPQVMLYGFLGLRPTGDGFTLAPSLPSGWHSLEVTRVHVQDHVVDLIARQDGSMSIRCRRAGSKSLHVAGPRFPDAELRLVAGETIELVPR